MGRFIYDNSRNSVEVDDRTLAHLRIVFMNKLRRGEPFMFDIDLTDGSGGHRSYWIHPGVPVQLQFFGGKSPRINRVWIEQLMIAASSSNGLTITPAPPAIKPQATEARHLQSSLREKRAIESGPQLPLRTLTTCRILVSASGYRRRMTIETYVAVLHDGPRTSADGEPVLCPLQPDGTPKRVLDHHGVLYRLNDVQTGARIFDYRRVEPR